MLEAEDRLAVIETVHRWSHVVDGSDRIELAEVLTDDATFEIVEAGGTTVIRGSKAIEAHFTAERAASPLQLRRHVRNTIVVESSAAEVRTRSYYLLTGVPAGGLASLVASGVYEDELVAVDGAWRIRRRGAIGDGGGSGGGRAEEGCVGEECRSRWSA